ncbi:hypothetical protein NPIL_70791 [Nephila pilipes]|uniref:Uncharacterized protein n=1 Tax=Nephila pilipes TaxID=299642 RepID=A0A8X6Q4R0_NEPPI|nr:hypothetical protein NPIL_70791 [Nephila pilipes]
MEKCIVFRENCVLEMVLCCSYGITKIVMWEFLKIQVYREQFAILIHPRGFIFRPIRGISAELLGSSVEHTVLRLERVVVDYGTHVTSVKRFVAL